MVWDRCTGREVQSGYLIIVRFVELYRTYVSCYGLTRDHYVIPRLDRSPEQSSIRYRGLDRDVLKANAAADSLAPIFLEELEEQERCVDGFLFREGDVRDTLEMLEDAAHRYEVVWTREVGASAPPPPGFVSLGVEATYFLSDHFSPSCDCMLFPQWHGTDDDGTRFLDHFHRLNRHGLFASKEHAELFLADYLSLDWTERGDYFFAEVFAPAEDASG